MVYFQSNNLDRRYLQLNAQKHVKSNEKQYRFQSISHVFWYSIEDNSGFRGWILIQDSVLETLLVVDYMIKILPQNFWNFLTKFGCKDKIR